MFRAMLESSFFLDYDLQLHIIKSTINLKIVDQLEEKHQA